MKDAQELVVSRIEALSRELQALMERKQAISNEMQDIDIRLTQLSGAMHELTSLSEELKTQVKTSS